MTEQDRTELELVQEALASLPRPATPPRLRRAVMARVRAEARAESAALQVQTWNRTEEDGWTMERWEGAGWSGETLPAPMPARITHTHRRQDAPGRTTIYQFTQTD